MWVGEKEVRRFCAQIQTQGAQEIAVMVSVQDDALDEVSLQDEDSVEFRMLMVYAQRTLPNSKFQELMSRTSVQKGDGGTANGDGHRAGDSPSPSSKKDKKKSLRRRLTPKCLRPIKAEEAETLYLPKEKGSRSPASNQEETRDEERVRGLVQRLAAIVRKLEKRDQESMEFRGLKRVCSIEHDGDGEEDLIENIVAFLRSEGDKLNNEMVQEQTFLQRLQALWSYGFYQRLTETYVAQMTAASEAEEAQQSSKIALCVHATTRLTALDSHPMNRMFGFGTRYIKENYSQWIMEHGGWEKVLGVQDVHKEESGEE